MSTGQGFEGYNMYAYCGNNPVILVDAFGEKSISIRNFVESHGGKVTWNNRTKIATFTLNGRTISTHVRGNNETKMKITNKNGSMMADDYRLACYFNVADWAQYYPGFFGYTGKKGEEGNEGFEVSTTKDFLDKDFCWDFAGSILKIKGKNGRYLGKDQLGIAKECYAHAVLYVFFATTTSIHSSLGDVYFRSAKEIGYIGKDPNDNYYDLIWWLVNI